MTRQAAALLISDRLLSSGSSLYLGRSDDQPIFGSAKDDHLLALGPPRCGKTSGLLSPSVATHPGPVVVVSTRDDIVQATISARTAIAEAHGGSVSEVALGGYRSGRLAGKAWSLTDGCHEWNTALDRAAILASTAVPDPKDRFWRDSAADLLSGCLLGAALLNESDREMARRLKATDVSPYHSAVFNKFPEEHNAPFAFAGVSNDNAMAEDTKRSVFAVVNAQTLGALKFETETLGSTFNIADFVKSAGTVYITIPPERAVSVQPLVSAFVEAITAAWRESSTRYGTLLLALDEVANAAPLPNLPKIITAGAGDGIQCALGMQEPGQADRWADEANIVTGSTTHVAIFAGLRAPEYLSGLSDLSEREVQYEVHITVPRDTPHGPRLAPESRLIHERRELEQELGGVPGRLKAIAAKRVGSRLLRQRLREGVRPRFEGDRSAVEALLEELHRFTSVAHVPHRRATIAIDNIAQGRPNSFYLLTGARGTFRTFTHWSQDPLWRGVLGQPVSTQSKMI